MAEWYLTRLSIWNVCISKVYKQSSEQSPSSEAIVRIVQLHMVPIIVC